MNKCFLLGNITKDLEVKKVSSGKSVLDFTVAINNGEQTEFVNCQAWEKTADTIGTFLQKGSKILVEGRIKTTSYDGKTGKVYKTFVLVDRFEFVESRQHTNSEYKGPKAVAAGDNSFNYSQESEYEKNFGQGSGQLLTNNEYTSIKSDDLPFY